MSALDLAFRKASPRLNPRRAPLASLVIFTAVVGFWIVLFAQAFLAGGWLAWSVGVVYLGYDTILLLFVASQSIALWRGEPAPSASPARRPSLGVIVAAHNEAAALSATIDALLRQDDPADRIWLADDGSTDGSAAVMRTQYGLADPGVDRLGESGEMAPSLRWLRLSHRGKARALNAALEHVDTEVVLTVDADTLLEPDALGVIRRAFAADPGLIVGGGVLSPRCAGGALASVLQEFQTYEYIRNFLARYAWSRCESLLLISGAFAAFRTDAIRSVGGFDPECLTEDYELIHRLQRRAIDEGLERRVRIIGRARATTDAPAGVAPFLRQRRRWFAGFLQTQYWNRDMVGASRFGALGLAMMPVKSIDTLQPFYGLAASALLVDFLVTGRLGALLPASVFTLGKIVLDMVNAAASVAVYRRWTGDRRPLSSGRALLYLLVEPFSFQILRHLGAAWGWVALATGSVGWGRSSRGGVAESSIADGERAEALRVD